MNAPLYTEPFADGSDGSDASLLAHLGLTPQAAQSIYELMRTGNLTFKDAAVRLGLITPEQIEAGFERERPSRSETAGLIETAIRRISSDRQIVVKQGERVNPGPQLILAHDSDNPRSEKIRALRTELLLLSEASSGANVIALLSACPGEGRSQLAAELAISFSQLGRRSLLVDADLRRPTLHMLFGAANEPGLSEAIALNQRAMFHPVEGLPQLSLLTSGQVPRNPLELLSDGRFEKMLADWRRGFDFVVIDTPPVSAYADGLAIATLAGRILVLSRGQHTSFRDTREFLRRVATTQSQILGAVINHF